MKNLKKNLVTVSTLLVVTCLAFLMGMTKADALYRLENYPNQDHYTLPSGRATITKHADEKYFRVEKDAYTAIGFGYDIKYPQFSGMADKTLETWLNNYFKSVYQDRTKFYAIQEKEYGHIKPADIKYGDEAYYDYDYYVSNDGSRYLSIVDLHHGSYGVSGGDFAGAFNIDLQEQKMLTGRDLYNSMNANQRKQLLNLVDKRIKVLEGIPSENVQTDLYGKKLDHLPYELNTAEESANFYFTDKALVLIYDQGEIGPRSATTIHVDIPFTQLSGILSEDIIKGATSPKDLTENRLVIDGNIVKTTAKEEPVLQNGRTLVPIRILSETLNYQVEWNAELRQVTITDKDLEVKLIIDENKAMVNGTETNLDVPPTLRNSSTFVPIRFIAESFNCEVDWENNETGGINALVTTK